MWWHCRTFGYLAPEYFMHGKVTDKINVYAFGVVLLELLSGRKPICVDQSKGQESLVLWANLILESGKFAHLLNPNLEADNRNDLIEKLLLAATLCIKRAAQDRPQMGLIFDLYCVCGHWKSTNSSWEFVIDVDRCGSLSSISQDMSYGE